MAMQATAIRFAPEEKTWIQSYADFVGKSFSDVVREAVLELVEDAADMHTTMPWPMTMGPGTPSKRFWPNSAARGCTRELPRGVYQTGKEAA